MANRLLMDANTEVDVSTKLLNNTYIHECRMAQEYPGFLTDRFREYLRGEQDITDSPNPSRERGEFRERFAGAKRDMALIQTSQEEWVKKELLKAERNVHDPRGLNAPMTDKAIDRNYNAAKAQSESVGVESGGVEDVLDKMQQKIEDVDSDFEDQMQQEIQQIYEELFAAAFVETVAGMLEGAAGNSEKQEIVEGLIEGAWPKKEEVLQTAREQFSND